MLLYKKPKKGVVIKYELFRSGEDSFGVRAEMTVHGRYLESSMIKEAFSQKDRALSFLKLLAKNGIEPCHLEDVASDYYCGP